VNAPRKKASQTSAAVAPPVLEPVFEPVLTLEQVAERLQLKPETVRELLRKRGNRKPLPSLKAGKFLRFRWSHIERWLDESQERKAA